ncbi:MAG: VIT1/CCC1 transporter family protein [Candidatus Melainabacteria bacterium]|jgi:vacuolar iron transporter family protein|nr:VIT1/CCC1 transporter family protein [Candidatus Melainabacteria bacterium]
MPQTPHIERHFTAGQSVRDIVIGMSDGLTVPFALAAGLSGAVSNSGIIVTAGLAEVAAGAIAMGLGGYLATKSDHDHYCKEKDREWREVRDIPEAEKKEVSEIFKQYGMTDEDIQPILLAFQKHPDHWVNFMMRFELGLEMPEPGQAFRSAFTIGLAYILGGIIPLMPYMVLKDTQSALGTSVVVTMIALAIFGYLKGRFSSNSPLKSCWQMVLVGGLAAATAFGMTVLFNQFHAI